MRKGTLWHFRANMRFLNIRVALDCKSTPLKTFLKNLVLPQSYDDGFRNTKSAWDFTFSLELSMSLQLLLALYLCPPSNPLLRILLFLLLWLSDRTLAANASLCQCTGALSPLKPELKKTHVDDWCAAQADSQNACNISSALLSSDGLERRIWQGRHLDPGGGFTRKHDRRPDGQLPAIPCIWDQQRPPRTLRDYVQSASALSALKKSLVANLSAKRQLSVAKLSAKRNVSLAKRDF